MLRLVTEVKPVLREMSLAHVVAFWRPGSQDWTWAEEYADLINDPVTERIRERVIEEGIGFVDDISPVLLGNDGRVWDGHHRICIALQFGLTHLMVELSNPPVAQEEIMKKLPMPTPLPSTRTAFANEEHCELVKYHAPHPVMLQHHHQKPVELQNRLYGKIVYGPTLWLCGSCHDSVHAWLYWLLGERRQPPGVGRAAKAEAERTYQWYLGEKERLGK